MLNENVVFAVAMVLCAIALGCLCAAVVCRRRVQAGRGD